MQTHLTTKRAEDELPLFPLHVVLFPGGILPLHIFEPRYRLMIQSCLDNQQPFGVVLIKNGREIGETAEPYLVGTVAQIIDVERLEDGRMNLLTRGQVRFEILELKRNLPYLVGRVRVLDVEEIDAYEHLESLAVKANQLYRTYESLLTELIADWKVPEQIPTSPRYLSYQIGTRLQIPLEEKQQLLETLPIHQLLSREIKLLDRENLHLKAGLIARRTLGERGRHDPPLWKNFSLN